MIDSRLAKFGPVWGASGVQNTHGKGWWYHKVLRFCPGFTLKGVTLVTKTVTAEARDGNMPIDNETEQPREWFPKAIAVTVRSWWHGAALNAISLSNIGIEARLAKGDWQRRKEPLVISFMAVSKTLEGRLAEARAFVAALLPELWKFSGLVALQVNLSCPNVGLHAKAGELVEESRWLLDILSVLRLPILFKINCTLPVEVACEIAADPRCSGLVDSNTIHWDELPKLGIDRRRLFGSDISPLTRRNLPVPGPGGLSGRPIRDPTLRHIRAMREAGMDKFIVAEGCILCPSDVDLAVKAGANAIGLGSIVFLRPWHLWLTIRRAYLLLGRRALAAA